VISFIAGVIALIGGYFVYGKIIEKIFKADTNQPIPAVRINDGVDFVVFPTWRAELIPFLNIAGRDRFLELSRAYSGDRLLLRGLSSAVFLRAWRTIILRCAFAPQRRHDHRRTCRHVSGKVPKYIMRIFSVALLIFVGVVFVHTPAQIPNMLINPDNKDIFTVALVVILAYHIRATILPIDKLIGRISPVFFSAALLNRGGIIIVARLSRLSR
jgi:carbon starvation protein CstA